MQVDERTPAVLGTRPRSVDAYRTIIERYDVNGLSPVERLPDREKVIEGLVQTLKPLLDAIVDADATTAEVAKLEATLREHDGGPIAQVARGRLLGARERRDLAVGRVRELTRDEHTVLRYAVLRQLVRTPPR